MVVIIYSPNGQAGARSNRVRCERRYVSMFPSAVASLEEGESHASRAWTPPQGRSPHPLIVGAPGAGRAICRRSGSRLRRL